MLLRLGSTPHLLHASLVRRLLLCAEGVAESLGLLLGLFHSLRSRCTAGGGGAWSHGVVGSEKRSEKRRITKVCLDVLGRRQDAGTSYGPSGAYYSGCLLRDSGSRLQELAWAPKVHSADRCTRKSLLVMARCQDTVVRHGLVAKLPLRRKKEVPYRHRHHGLLCPEHTERGPFAITPHNDCHRRMLFLQQEAHNFVAGSEAHALTNTTTDTCAPPRTELEALHFAMESSPHGGLPPPRARYGVAPRVCRPVSLLL